MRASRVGDAVERFQSRFEVDDNTGCWNWTGSTNAKGYGLIGGVINGKRYAPKGQRMLAHRVSWIIYIGDIPPSDAAHGTVVRHKCDNPKCVNPNHLQLGTQADNVKDMIERGRRVITVRCGADHWNSAFSHEDIDYICSVEGRTKELAEKFGVHLSAIKNVRRRNGFGSKSPEKYVAKNLSDDVIAKIRNSENSIRRLAEEYRISKTTVERIRKGITYKSKE